MEGRKERGASDRYCRRVILVHHHRDWKRMKQQRLSDPLKRENTAVI